MEDSDQKTRILLVEDNLVVQQYLKAALMTNPTNEIVGITPDGLLAVSEAVRLKPDLILLDLYLAGMDGIEVIRHVMNRAACPIVVISSELGRQDRDLTFEAQRAGAVSVLAKPCGMESHQFEAFSENLCHIVKLMSKVKVTRRWFEQKAPVAGPPAVIGPVFSIDCELLVIGSSAGGPAGLYKILEALSPDFPFAVLIAQHIAKGFAPTLCDWLGKTGCKVKIPAEGETILAGNVYIAPDDRHMVVGKDGLLHLVDNPSARFSPNVDMLFESVAQHVNKKVCAMILTGMGDDGTAGMTSLYHKGMLTIAEAESSCVIFGMPKMAIHAGVVRAILSLDEICDTLRQATIRIR